MASIQSLQRLRQQAVIRAPFISFAIDSGLWIVALIVAEWLRYDYNVSKINWGGLAVVTATAIGLHGLIGRLLGVYGRRFRYGSLDEVATMTVSSAITALVMTAVVWASNPQFAPRSVPVLGGLIAICGAGGVRIVWRTARTRNLRRLSTHPIVVVGAGEAAYQIIRSLNADALSPYRPVAMLDDDPNKRHLRFEDVRVEGVVDDIALVASRYCCGTVLLAIPSADTALLRRVDDLCRVAKLQLLTLPPVHQLFGAVVASDIRRVTTAEVLGRESTDIDTDAVKQYVSGRRVMVTGAGGSIGSELCRQLARFSPAALVMLDRDESGLHAVQLSIDGRGLLDDGNLVLADIRDAERVREVFRTHQPEIVFHAAALKHLPLLEHAPDEAWKTNVLGTHTVLEAAVEAGVATFVNISTDKAAEPVSVLGVSKRITERLTAHRAVGGARYMSVRFGNVLGSRGSVLATFRAQAETGGPITVTHPEVTRYFMTVGEAVRLTIYAGAIGAPGEVMVLDMGKPVRIVDVAQRFANQHTPPLEIVFTGLRPGEKLHEDLVAADEHGVRREHPLISHVPVPQLAPARLQEFASINPAATKDALHSLSLADLEQLAS